MKGSLDVDNGNDIQWFKLKTYLQGIYCLAGTKP